MTHFGLKIALPAVIAAAFLVGCGGGGDAASTPPVGSNPPAGTPTTPTPTTPDGANPPATTPPAVAAINALALVDAASATPFTMATTGAQRTAQLDGCYRDNGSTKAYVAQDFEENKAERIASRAFSVGAVRSNASVVSDTTSTNTDGTTRRVLEVKYNVAYTDGSSVTGATEKFISGSSSGTVDCTTPQAGSDFRVLGNGRLANVQIRAENILFQQNKLSDGTDFPSAGNSNVLRRQVAFRISDPLGNANYAVVTGPGQSTVVNGVTESFSLKMLSPRLLRSAPELLGKPRNVPNFKDTDQFSPCRNATGGSTSIRASAADCVANGANGNDYGISLTLGTASGVLTPADAQFDALQFVAGSVYTVSLYNDDGWKTVNGQAGKTPVAVYTTTMSVLPYTFAEMGAGLPAVDKHPQVNMGTGSLANNAHLAITSATTSTATLAWSLPASSFSDNRVFRLGVATEFFQGAQNNGANCSLASVPAFPRLRFSTDYFPSSAASTNSSGVINVTGTPATLCRKSYAEFSIGYSDRQDRRVVNIVNWQ